MRLARDVLRVVLLAVVSLFLATSGPAAEARASHSGVTLARKPSVKKKAKKKTTAKKAKRPKRKSAKKKRRKAEKSEPRRPMP